VQNHHLSPLPQPSWSSSQTCSLRLRDAEAAMYRLWIVSKHSLSAANQTRIAHYPRTIACGAPNRDVGDMRHKPGTAGVMQVATPPSAGLSYAERELTDARRERAFQPSSELFPGNSLLSDVGSRGGIRAGPALARPRRPKRCEPPELDVTAMTRMTFLEDESGSTRAMCGFMSSAVAAQAWRLV
jgi:hypothetical protein